MHQIYTNFKFSTLTISISVNFLPKSGGKFQKISIYLQFLHTEFVFPKVRGSKCLLLQMTCLPPWHYSNSWQLRNLMKLFKFYISCNIIACAYLLLFLCLFIVLLFQLQELSFIQINPFGQLTILGTQEVDSGEYECVATNEAGSTSEIVTLEVGCKLFQL